MMEVYHNLFVGNQDDYDCDVSRQSGWAVVHACKEPYHRQALGYISRGAPKDHPEYLVARRGNRLILNIVDANDPSFFAKEMINQALDFIDKSLSSRKKVLVHCNQGESRSPSIALIYLASRTDVLPKDSLEAAEKKFILLYPLYNPKYGLRMHIFQNWPQYCNRQ